MIRVWLVVLLPLQRRKSPLPVDQDMPNHQALHQVRIANRQHFNQLSVPDFGGFKFFAVRLEHDSQVGENFAEIDAARLLVWRASWMGRNQVPFENAEGSMSKLKSGEVAVWVTERAIQILGGNGYTREFPVERWHRDAKIYDIFEGTAEIQQLVIARAISGMHIK